MAIEIENINSIVEQVINVQKPFVSKDTYKVEPKFDKQKNKYYYPEYYPTYNLQVSLVKDIYAHSKTGYFPEELFNNRAPNETDDEYAYRKRNYSQIQDISVYLDFANTVKRGWHKSNWSIKYKPSPDKFEDDDFENYVRSKIPIYESVDKFMTSIVTDVKIQDAEGVIAIKPYNIPITYNEEGEPVIDGTQLIDCAPYYYNSKQIVAFEREKYYLIETNEKSVVFTDSERTKKKKVGFVYEFYDDSYIYKIIQTGYFYDYSFEITVLLNHNLNYVPVTKLKGNPVIEDGEFMWISPFTFALTHLNQALLDESNLQVSKAKSVFPVRVMLANPCVFNEEIEGSTYSCQNGVIEYYINDKTYTKNCPNCHGSGLIPRVGPMKDFLVRPPENALNGGEVNISDPFKYVEPQITTLEFLRSEITFNRFRGRQILHLPSTGDKVQGREDITATSKAIEQNALAAFISPIIHQEFQIFEFILNTIGYMRYGVDVHNNQKPVVVEPISFTFTTEEDFLERLKVALEAGAPSLVINEILINYLNTIYFNEETATKVFQLIIDTDQLLPLQQEVVDLKYSRGEIALWETILHTRSTSLVNELILEQEAFLEQDFIKQREQLIEKAKQKAVELKTENDTSTSTIDKIMNATTKIRDTNGVIEEPT